MCWGGQDYVDVFARKKVRDGREQAVKKALRKRPSLHVLRGANWAEEQGSESCALGDSEFAVDLANALVCVGFH